MPDYIDMMPRVNEILATDLPDIEKLTKAFGYLVQQHIEIARKEQELQKALGDEEALLKLQVQANTMEYVLGIFSHCYRLVTGRKVSLG